MACHAWHHSSRNTFGDTACCTAQAFGPLFEGTALSLFRQGNQGHVVAACIPKCLNLHAVSLTHAPRDEGARFYMPACEHVCVSVRRCSDNSMIANMYTLFMTLGGQYSTNLHVNMGPAAATHVSLRKFVQQSGPAAHLPRK
jgi:hypothetical protein